MSTYKVIQDVEAEDKLVGPLTLHQFIYAGIAAVCLYLSFLSVTKGAPYMLAIFLPVAGVMGFFAFPWGKDQPTEIWALAKIRFAIKPRKRIWDQSGVREMVTVTVPKKIERQLTNGLDQSEVRSRLTALASTIDSRGWAIKNVNVNMTEEANRQDNSDRLVLAASMPQAVSDIDVRAADDILDERANPVAQNFDSMINASAVAHRQQLMAQMQQPAVTNPAPMPAPQQNTDWFMPQPITAQTPYIDPVTQTPFVAAQPLAPGAPHAATPTAEEEALVEKFKAENSSMTPAYAHMKTLKTPEELMAEDAARRAAMATRQTVTPKKQAAIINLAQNDDLDVATIARQAHKASEDDGEVVIPLR